MTKERRLNQQNRLEILQSRESKTQKRIKENTAATAVFMKETLEEFDIEAISVLNKKIEKYNSEILKDTDKLEEIRKEKYELETEMFNTNNSVKGTKIQIGIMLITVAAAVAAWWPIWFPPGQ